MLKISDESLTLQGLQAGLARIGENHPLSPTLAAKYSSRQAGIGGEERVADIFRKHSFTMDHRIFHDVSPKTSYYFSNGHLVDYCVSAADFFVGIFLKR